MPVPFFDLSRQHAETRKAISKAMDGVLESQSFILGPEVSRFEAALAKLLGGLKVVGCASGTDALILALLALGVGSGDEVVTTPFSFVATASSITRVGAKPVFADLSPGSFHLDPAAAAAAVTARTKAILPAHLFGFACDIPAILEVADRARIPVVEDAAQALGTRIQGRPAGAFGRVGCFSFYPTKNLGAFGDAGAVATADARIEESLRRLRVHGQSERYRSLEVGLNSRLDTVQAAVLLAKLPRLERWNEARRRHAAFYRASLSEIPSIVLPEEPPGIYGTYHQFVIRAEHRDRLAAHLRDRGIGHAIYYPVPLHLQPCFAALGYREGSLPEAEQACREALALPVFPEITEPEREQVAAAVREFYGRSA